MLSIWHKLFNFSCFILFVSSHQFPVVQFYDSKQMSLMDFSDRKMSIKMGNLTYESLPVSSFHLSFFKKEVLLFDNGQSVNSVQKICKVIISHHMMFSLLIAWCWGVFLNKKYDSIKFWIKMKGGLLGLFGGFFVCFKLLILHKATSILWNHSHI